MYFYDCVLLKNIYVHKIQFLPFYSIYFLVLYQQIVDEFIFPDTDRYLQIKLMISLFSCSGSGPQQCFDDQDSYKTQFLQCLVQPDRTPNELTEEFSSY